VVPGDSKKRMDYINRLDPKARKAMMDRLGLYSDEDYETEEEYLAAMGKDLSGSNALDIINYDGEYMKQFGPKLVNNINRGDVSTLPYSVNEQILPVVDDTIPYRLGDPNKGKALDVKLGRYFNQGGRVPRNMGGIMNAVPRQGYFLGGIGKSIGKAFKGVAKAAGKVLKSPLGKAAALGLGAYYMPGFGIKATGGFGNMFQPSGFFGKALLNKGAKDFALKNINPFKLAGLVTLGGAAMGPAKQDPSLMTDRGGKMPDFLTGGTGTPAELRANIRSAVEEAQGDPVKLAAIDEKYNYMLNLGLPDNLPYPNYAVFASGGRVPAQEGGLMNLGGMEKDYRNEGGFVPIGKEEKADDVPARLSVNEFVFTADAVRNAGGGDIDKGAEVMENMMKNLENGGRISEESQGNTGAQEMFSVSERIGEVI
jgi:hypothetical protein